MPRWNWLPTDPVYMDLETQSLANLRKVGGKAYINDPSTRLLSAVFSRGSRLIVWCPRSRLPPGYSYTGVGEFYDCEDVPPPVLGWIAGGCTFVAHNAETFDARAWDRFGMPPVQWCDTLHYCRLHGYPGSLDAASKALGGKGKADTTAMHLLTGPPGVKLGPNGVIYSRGTAPLWDKLIAYNIADVRELERIAGAVLHDTAGEARVMAVSSDINERGIMVDLPFTRKLRDCWDHCRNESIDEIKDITGGALDKDSIGSVKKVKDYLSSLGFRASSLNAQTVNQIINDPEGFLDQNPECYYGDSEDDEFKQALALLALRQNAVRATVGKLDRIFKVVDPDSCVRNVLQYHGAGPGRYTGRDIQPHNFPRGQELGAERLALLCPDLDYGRVKRVASECRHPQLPRNLTPAEVLATLTRCTLRARPGKSLVIVDFSAIEARVLAWLARCDSMLHTFSDPRADIYCDAASRLYGYEVRKKDHPTERQVGKQIVLGCGYGMAARKFGLSCKVQLVDLSKAGVTPAQCVEAYRSGYPEVPALWRAYDQAAKYAVQNPGRTVVAGRCLFGVSGGFLWIELPSGRKLKYRNPRIGPKQLVLEDGRCITVQGVSYDSPYGYRKDIYGGLECENIDQATSRDLLVYAISAINPVFPCVLHVHDEGVFECDEGREAEALDWIGRKMVELAPWAAGLPLAVEGFTSTHYTKAAFPGAEHGKFSAQV